MLCINVVKAKMLLKTVEKGEKKASYSTRVGLNFDDFAKILHFWCFIYPVDWGFCHILAFFFSGQSTIAMVV